MTNTNPRLQPKSRRLAPILAVAVLLIAAAPVGLGSSDDAAGSGPSARTFSKVWYRSDRGGPFGGGRDRGDLVLEPTEIRFRTPKREVVIPLAAIHQLSWGTMAGDVDTSWAVIEFESDDERHVVGFRDGRKLGYGTRSPEIYEALREQLRASGLGPYAAPDGYSMYDDLERQLVFARPSTWTITHRVLAASPEGEPYGVLLISPETLVPSPDLSLADRAVRDRELMDEVDHGLVTAIFVEREPARRGMTCEGFQPKARKRLVERALDDPLFDGERASEDSVRAETGQIDGCGSMRLLRRSSSGDGDGRVLELHAVARDGTLFLFGIRSREGRYERDREVLNRVLSTVRFSIAKP